MFQQLRQQLRSRIRYAIILPYLLLAAAILALLGALSFWIIANNLQDQLNNTLQTTATNVGTALESQESRMLDDMRLVVSAPANATEALSSTAEAFLNEDRPQITRLMGLAADFYAPSRLLAFDRNGLVLVDKLDLGLQDRLASLEGSDVLASNPMVRAVLSGQRDAIGDKYTGLIQFNGANPITMLFVVAPVKATVNGSDQIVGALAFAEPLDDVLQQLSIGGARLESTLSDTSIIAVLNSTGQVLASYPPDRTGLELTADQLTQLRQEQSLYNVTNRGELSFQLLYNPLRIRRSLDGFFVVGVPRSSISNAWDESRIAVALIALLALVSVLAMGFAVTRRITRPLGELATTALQVKSGDLERRSSIERNDELGTLASVLNEMTDRLLDLYRTSRQLGAELSVEGVLEQTQAALRNLYPDTTLAALIRSDDQWQHYTAQGTAPIAAPFSASQLQTMPSVVDLPQLPELAPAVLQHEPGARLLLPLRTQQKSIGVLVLNTAEEPTELAAITEPLTAVSSMAATAMNNALLYSTVQDEALRKQAILQSIADGVLVLDGERRVALANAAAAAMLGLEQAALTDQAFDALPLTALHSSPELFAPGGTVATLYESGKRVLSLSAAPIISSEGRTTGEVLVLHDVTAEREVDKAKTDFIATISHELRTPLSSICGYTDLLLRGLAGPLAEEQSEFLTTIRRQAQSMVDVLQNVIIIASIESGSMTPQIQPYPVKSLIDQALATTRKPIEDKNLGLSVDIDTELPYVLVDQDYVKIALTQLLDNARRYTTEGAITIRAFERADTIQIDIQDTGRGISEDDQQRLFTRFQRGGEQGGLATRERGAGLGLAIARQLVENLGGKIWATSKLNEGSTFSMLLPRMTEEQHTPTQIDATMVTA